MSKEEEKKKKGRKKKVEEEEPVPAPPLPPEPEEEPEEEITEVENPYTVTNRAISELVSPRDTMYYLSESQIRIILSAYEFANLPTYFGEDPVVELADYATKLKKYLVSKGGRGRRDILRVLRVSSGQVRENINKSLFKKLIGGGEEEEETEG